MSWKALIISGGIILILLAGSNFVTYKVSYNQGKKDAIASITQGSVRIDTVFVPLLDTVFVKADTIKVKAGKEVAESGTIFKTRIAIPVIMEEDTIGIINEKISFNPENETFNVIIEDLVIKPIEKYVPIVTKIYRTIPVEVSVDPPFYNTFWFGSVFATIALILVAIFL